MLQSGSLIPFHKNTIKENLLKMLILIIALLISLGVVTTADDYTNLSEQEKQEIIESQDIIITDVTVF